MSRKSLIQRNLKRTALYTRYFEKRNILKKGIYDKTISLEDRYKLINKLSSLSRNSSKTRLRNRCSITGRPRGFYRKMGISRIMLRDLAGKGEIPGLLKSSW